MEFKTLSLNTRGFTQPFRDYFFYNLLFEADIFCFQEVQISDPSFFQSFAEKWQGSCFWSPALGKQGGVITCLSDSFDYEVIQWKRDTSGRVVSVVIKINDYSFNIVNIYAPTNLTERRVFFENLHEYFLPSDSIVIASDFNCYEYQSDKTGSNLSCAKYLAHFRTTFNLVDAWHRLNPRSRQCTWFNSDFSIGSRLDKFLVSQSLFSFISNCEIKPFCLSDHDIVYLTLRLDDLHPRGPGLWKFNNSLLQDTNFIEYISDRMNALIEGIEHFPSVKLWWDFFKNSLQAEIISFSRTKRKNLSHERVVLTNEIIRLKALLVSGDFSVSSVIRDLENKLKDLVQKNFLALQSDLKHAGLRRGKNLPISSSSWSGNVFSIIRSLLFLIQMTLKFFLTLKLNMRLCNSTLICFHLRLLILFVNKRALPVLKITLTLRNNSHARGFYLFRNYPMLSKPLI